MCIGIRGKVVETYHEDDVLMGKVDFGGIARRVCLEHVPAAKPDDYVLVHVGFAGDEGDARCARQPRPGVSRAGARLQVPSGVQP
jgi:hydrogenase assembly chaperone HypC/HupF